MVLKQVLEGNRAWSLKHMLADFLLKSRTTPHSTTGISPAEVLMKHRLRTRLSLVKPTLAQAIETKQESKEEYKDLKNHWERQFSENDTVRVRNSQANDNSEKWILGRVSKVCGLTISDTIVGTLTISTPYATFLLSFSLLRESNSPPSPQTML